MKDLWHGRFDGDEKEDLRIWQVVKGIEEFVVGEKGVCFIGYNTDDGVKRNKGREGAKDGSDAIRTAMQSLPIIDGIQIYDYKNLDNKTLELAQEEYSKKVYDVINKKLLPIGIGGGHDIVFGSYKGIRKSYPKKKIGIINFDTHLDIRDYSEGGTSGTSFKQILDTDDNVKYAIVGFKNQGNTKRLIDRAKKFNVLMLDEELEENEIIEKVSTYFKDVDIVYITFCMDVFDCNQAPGVSAPTVMGLDAKKGKRILRSFIKDYNVVCVDFAEVNPKYDIDNRTAKLVATLVYDIMDKM